ncbi:C6 transcription factor [Apiospora aurea]|uniref:C6 transcription factor n=1 Tax=Apiospora aurea TaxID=335848 RepID=A0ABR1QUY1_9PEZI
MDGLAFRHNIVRFYTICSIVTKHRTNALFSLMKNMYSTEAELPHQARGRISPEAKQRMASRFPQFLHLIERFDVRPSVQDPDDEYGWTIVALPWEALRYLDTNQYGEALLLCKTKITPAIARWVVEHLDLPAESFTLILDGDPISQLSAKIFHESLGEPRSFVVTFTLGDPEEIIEIWRGLPKRDPFLPVDDPIDSWQSEWYSAWENDTGDTDISPEEAQIWQSYPIFYQTVAPLPDWSDLAMENGNNVDDGFLSADPNDDGWNSQDWTLEFA